MAPPRKTYRKKRKGYKGFSKAGGKSAYRPRFIAKEIQLLNRRPQMLTQKCVHQESFYLSQPAPNPIGSFSLLQCKAAYPANPVHWGDSVSTLTYPQTLTQTQTSLFNQFGAMYREAYVVGAKMEVHVKFCGRRAIGSFQANNPSQQENIVALGVINSKAGQTGLPINDLQITDLPSTFAERQNFRVARVMVAGNSSLTNSTAQATNLRTKDVKMTAYFSPKKMLGLKDVADHNASRFALDDAEQDQDKFEAPQFVLAIGHNCDNQNQGLPIVRGAHNDCYVTIKTTYIVKCVEPTDERGSNLIITTPGEQTLTMGHRSDDL